MFFINNYSFGQITLSPEIGFSYLPFTLYGANTENISNRIDLSFGVSAQLPLAKKWYVNTRISYSNREDMKWTDLCLCPGYLYSEFVHSDLNFDFTMMRVYKRLSIGLGPSFTRKFIKYNSIELNPNNSSFSTGSQNIFGINSRLSYLMYDFIILSVSFNHIVSKIEFYYEPNGRNRFDLTLAYRFKGRKR